MGMHEVLVKNEGEPVKGTPHYLRSMPKSRKDYEGKFTKPLLTLILDCSNCKFSRFLRHRALFRWVHCRGPDKPPPRGQAGTA